jgi:hypothetical protein
MGRKFLAWATGFDGAAIALTGLGGWHRTSSGALLAPDDTVTRLVCAAAWLVLGLLGRTLQVRLLVKDRTSERSPVRRVEPGGPSRTAGLTLL